MRFTQEQIDQAKQVPVERIAKSVGYTVVKKGRYFSLEKICGGDIQMEHMETALIF